MHKWIYNENLLIFCVPNLIYFSLSLSVKPCLGKRFSSYFEKKSKAREWVNETENRFISIQSIYKIYVDLVECIGMWSLRRMATGWNFNWILFYANEKKEGCVNTSSSSLLRRICSLEYHFHILACLSTTLIQINDIHQNFHLNWVRFLHARLSPSLSPSIFSRKVPSKKTYALRIKQVNKAIVKIILSLKHP